MAVPAFNRETDSDRLDYRLMIRSPVRLLHSRELLTDVVTRLREAGYEIVEIDASWLATSHMFRDIGNAVGYSCHDQWQCLHEGVAERIWETSGRAVGIVLVLTGFDVFANSHIDDARELLATIAGPCWSSMVVGRRAMCLVQTDDPSLQLGRIGVWPAFVSDWELDAGSLT
jgi:hypothetical protein